MYIKTFSLTDNDAIKIAEHLSSKRKLSKFVQDMLKQLANGTCCYCQLASQIAEAKQQQENNDEDFAEL